MLQVDPYATSFADHTTTGEYHQNGFTEQASFYIATNDKIANDNFPFAITKVEDSPLARMIEQGSVGTDWRPGGGHSTRVSYSYNTGATSNELEEVRQFNIDGSSSGFYAANFLQRVETTDANGNKEVVFVDSL